MYDIPDNNKKKSVKVNVNKTNNINGVYRE